jgi:hypothetical protein
VHGACIFEGKSGQPKKTPLIHSIFKSNKSLRKAKTHQFVRNPVISMKNGGRLVIDPFGAMTKPCHFVTNQMAFGTGGKR